MEMRRNFFTGSFVFSVLSYALTLQRELIGGENKIQMDVLLHCFFTEVMIFLVEKKAER